METGVRQEVSSIPLSTVAPRRVNTNNVSGRSSVNSDVDKKEMEWEIRQEEQRILQQLKSRDREVRAHEAAHMAAGRPYIRSGPSYTYQRGPDGRSYAIGGQVQLDTSEERNDPEATLNKAEQVRRAALAPAQPSPQDLSVAADASQLAARARVELAAQRRDELESQIQELSGESSDSSQETDEQRSSNPSVAAFSNAEIPPSTINQFV
ncbi:MAG TPA: putative metalloprotease CJM1_0395 family protein [Gammaproteobacteria bacterium]